MASPNGMQSTPQVFLDAQAHVWNHIFNFINSMCLKCTIQLGIPDIIHKHGKPIKLSELTKALSINKAKSLYIKRLMSIMIHSKFFIETKISKEDEEAYSLTPSSLLLLKDEPLSLTPLVLAMLDPILIDPWHHFSEWFKTDHSTPFMSIHGKTFWEVAGQDQRVNQFFNESMASDARLAALSITQHWGHVFKGLKSVVDVGGGTGTMANVIADAFPNLRCTVLDLPHVVHGLEGTKNVAFVGGDMFNSIPPADAVFMKWIMHDWPDEECLRILKKCKEAIPSKENGGKVIIVDMVIDHQKEAKAKETQLFVDMLMMVVSSGRERTEEEWAKLFRAAGFTSYNIIRDVAGLKSLIEVFP